MSWETVIGLEVHTQLATQSKIFSPASTAYGAPPNTQASIIDLGLPGVLPVLNEKVVEMALKFGLAIEAHIPPRSIFARKNYFYPDLPKGYQISQHKFPIIEAGQIAIELEDGATKTIRITRAHLEEDAGKSLHEDFHGLSGIDLNRAGTPLLEIVSEPDMRCAKEAVAYLKTLHTLVRYLGISDGNMQEGSFRCDANVSVRKKGDEQLGTRTELKNINSFRFVERAINFEVERQIETLEGGGTITQETRLYDPDKNTTRPMRSKEEATDYRYFPEPDLMPLEIDKALLEKIRGSLPELPKEKKNRFQKDYALSPYDAGVLVSHMALAHYFETVVSHTTASPKLAANWVMGELAAALNKHHLDITEAPISPEALATLLDRIVDNTISGKIAKTVFEACWEKGGNVDDIIAAKGLKQITDPNALIALAEKIIADNPKQVADYQSGKDKLFGFFVGQMMKASQGKANPAKVNDVLKKLLNG